MSKSVLEIIDKIWTEMNKIKSDTSRGLTPLAELLTEFSAIVWEQRRIVSWYKTSYEISFIQKKQERENDLKDLLAKWDKSVKITDAELKRYAEQELIDDYRAWKDNESVREEIDVIYDAYVRQYYSIKWDRSEGMQESKFYN